MPMASRNTKGSIGIRNTTSKYGGPTEIFPRFKASMNKGYKVPIRIKLAAANSSTLLNIKNDSRETIAKPASERSRGARQAYKLKAPPIQITKNARMNNPRLGSLAKACTDTSTPERTRKVPSKDNEKAKMASSTV